MKNKFVLLGILAGGLFLSSGKAQAPQSRFTRLSEREFADVAQISYFRGSKTVDLSEIGGDPNYRINALIFFNGGTQVELTSEAETRLKDILNLR